MLRIGKLGLKMGVYRAAHTQYAYIFEVPPPPPPRGRGSKIIKNMVDGVLRLYDLRRPV